MYKFFRLDINVGFLFSFLKIKDIIKKKIFVKYYFKFLLNC